jgi:UDP-N-acetylmuramyl-tripeptide synthetase
MVRLEEEEAGERRKTRESDRVLSTELEGANGMLLSQLLAGLEVTVDGPDVEISEVRDDSRAVAPGDLFVAVRGQTVDGHAFLDAVAQAGARAVVVDEERAVRAGVARARVASSSRALGRIAANRFGRPADALTLVGVTGTNGKTTTTFLAEALARELGVPGVVGTVSYRFRDVVRPAPFTTPSPLALHALLAEMRAAGVTHVAMECSSHALALDRLEDVPFAVAAFSNLTQDHLDFHGTMEAYRDAKARLFVERLREGGSAVINVDAEAGPFMAAAARAASRRVLTVSTRESADVRVLRATHALAGIDAELATPVGEVALRSPLIGGFNLDNLALAVGIGVGLGLGAAAIGRALSSVRGVPGRLERVAAPFGVFVDYAHTPDALERAMAALRPLLGDGGRLIVVFGCGGDRDRTKRPLMGRAVARDAELAIVTSDNPRTEEPQSILDMILEGVRKEPSPTLALPSLASARRGHVALVDRRAAIAAAIAAARPGDIVLIAGKGHEDYQIVGKTKHHFDDREEAAACVEKLAPPAGSPQS